MLRGMADLVGARKELKERVDELLQAQKETNRTLARLIKVLEELKERPDAAALAKAVKLTESWAQSAARTEVVGVNLEKALDRAISILS